MKNTIKCIGFALVAAIVLALTACQNDPEPTPQPKTASTPTATPASGAVADNTPITLASSTAEAAIYYTQDGTEPSEASTLYSDSGKPVITTGKLTLKAIAVKEGMNNSAVMSATYTIATGTPTANAGQDFTHDYYQDGVSFTLKGIAENGTILWECTARPEGAKQPTISNAAIAEPVVSGFDTLGNYTFKLTVTSGTVKDDDTVTVTLVATVPYEVSFVLLGDFSPSTTTLNFSPSATLPSGVTYKITNDKTNDTWGTLDNENFNGVVTGSPYFDNFDGSVADTKTTFTQTFYLYGEEITGINSKRIVPLVVDNFPTACFYLFSGSSDSGSVTLTKTLTSGSIPPYVVSFVTVAAGVTIDFSPSATLPSGVTYTVTDNSTPKKEWKLGVNGFNGQITASEYYSVAGAVTFTQTFYLNGIKITSAGSERVVVVSVGLFPSTMFATITSDTGSVTLQLPE